MRTCATVLKLKWGYAGAVEFHHTQRRPVRPTVTASLRKFFGIRFDGYRRSRPDLGFRTAHHQSRIYLPRPAHIRAPANRALTCPIDRIRLAAGNHCGAIIFPYFMIWYRRILRVASFQPRRFIVRRWIHHVLISVNAGA
ncbi:hypothetical protein RSAG8_04325, partial [Rhizoctonia solani AG-8 WAC10335]